MWASPNGASPATGPPSAPDWERLLGAEAYGLWRAIGRVDAAAGQALARHYEAAHAPPAAAGACPGCGGTGVTRDYGPTGLRGWAECGCRTGGRHDAG